MTKGKQRMRGKWRQAGSLPVCLLSPQPPDKPHHPQQHTPINIPANQPNDFTSAAVFAQLNGRFPA